MMSEQAQRIESVFMAALEQETLDAQLAFVEQQCGEDRRMLGEVCALLNSHQQSRGPLDVPPPGLARTENASIRIEAPGSRIRDYKLLQKIGEGGFGVVFMAEQVAPVHRRVALKIIKPGMDTKEVIARFEAERQALAMMDHPNIAQVFDGGETESGRPYFVMELVRGIPITDYCDKEDLTPRDRLNLFVDICHAVQHAHQKGILHRDIKPSNILVAQQDGKPLVKVIDFGVAKAIHHRLTDKTLFTNFFQIIGTPLYMSPEQANANSMDIDTRSDIYSLGVLLYELLVGITPFDQERLRNAAYDEMRRIIREEDPPSLSARLSTLGDTLSDVCSHRKIGLEELTQLFKGDLDWITMKALDKDRSRRYESAGAFAEDVQRFLENEPIVARPPSPAYRLQKFWHRNRTACITSIIIVTLITFAAATSTVQAIILAHSLNSERALREKLVRRDEAVDTATNELLALTTDLTRLSTDQNKAAEVGEQMLELARVKWGPNDERTMDKEILLARLHDNKGWNDYLREGKIENMASSHFRWYALWSRMSKILGDDNPRTKTALDAMVWHACVYAWVYVEQTRPTLEERKAIESVKKVLSSNPGSLSTVSLALTEFFVGNRDKVPELLKKHFEYADAGTGLVLDALFKWSEGDKEAALDSYLVFNEWLAGLAAENARKWPRFARFWKKAAVDAGLPEQWPPIDWKREEHLKAYDRLIARFPRVTVCYMRRADTHGRLSQWDEAARDFRKVTELTPNDWSGWKAYGAVCLETGDVDGYRQACGELHRLWLNTKDPSIFAEWIYLTTASDQSECDFCALLDKPHEQVLQKTGPAELFLYGSILYRCGQYKDVDVQLRGYASPITYALRAMAAKQLGRVREAQQMLDDAREKLSQFALDGEMLPNKHQRSAEYCLCHAMVREAESLIDSGSRE